MPSQPKPESGLRATALNALARREFSRFELERKLSGKGYNGTSVAQLLDQLESEGLLSDSRFAESFVCSRRQRGFGPLRIKMELRERGVDDALIRTNLDDPAIEWLGLARQAFQKRFGREKIRDTREYARRVRFLQGRGFSKPTIMAVLKELE
jgi:regulatory protein